VDVSDSTGVVWTSTGTLRDFGITNVELEFAALAAAGLTDAYGCVDLDTCPETTKVKSLRYADATGSVVEHRYATGDPSVPAAVYPPWTRVQGFFNAIAECSTDGASIKADDDCTGGELP
jgi:hypothetical protein